MLNVLESSLLKSILLLILLYFFVSHFKRKLCGIEKLKEYGIQIAINTGNQSFGAATKGKLESFSFYILYDVGFFAAPKELAEISFHACFISKEEITGLEEFQYKEEFSCDREAFNSDPQCDFLYKASDFIAFRARKVSSYYRVLGKENGQIELKAIWLHLHDEDVYLVRRPHKKVNFRVVKYPESQLLTKDVNCKPLFRHCRSQY